MNEHEQNALLRLRDAAISTRPMIERLRREQAEVKDFLTTMRFMMTMAPNIPGTEMLTGQVERTRHHVDALFGLVLMMQGTMSMVAGIVSEHMETEQEEKA